MALKSQFIKCNPPLNSFPITDRALVSHQKVLVHGCDPPENGGLGCTQPGPPSVVCVGIRLSQTEESKSALRRRSPSLVALNCAALLVSRIRQGVPHSQWKERRKRELLCTQWIINEKLDLITSASYDTKKLWNSNCFSNSLLWSVHGYSTLCRASCRRPNVSDPEVPNAQLMES